MSLSRTAILIQCVDLRDAESVEPLTECLQQDDISDYPEVRVSVAAEFGSKEAASRAHRVHPPRGPARAIAAPGGIASPSQRSLVRSARRRSHCRR